MFRTLLVSALLLAASPTAWAGDPEPPAIEKKIKAKKLEKLLAGTWLVHPIKEPELSQWLMGMAALDLSVEEVAAQYRLSPELAARLELAKVQGPPELPAELKAMLADGVSITFDGQGLMTGTFGGETMSGTYNVVRAENNLLEVNTRPKEGREDVINMTWVDADRMIWTNAKDGGELAVARVE